MVARKVNLSENWSNLPSVNLPAYGTIGVASILHPILQSITSQISQDLLNSISIQGSADELARQKKSFSVDGWNTAICQAVYQSLLSGSAYLLFDFGDTDLTVEPADLSVASPLRITANKPTPSDYDDQAVRSDTVDQSRYLKFDSPFPFPFSTSLQAELIRHDALTDGVIDMVKGQGIIKVGIDNLFEILTSNVPASKLYSRLSQLKQANTGNGVLAYDLNRESVDVIPKQMGRECDAIKIVENRISAMTGLPSFIIWGHTDGDGYGIQSALHLYSQRIQSISQMYFLPVMNYLLEMLGYDLYCECKDLFVESEKDKTDRLTKIADSLIGLQGIGAITSIEVRDTLQSSGLIDMVLNPNPQIVESQTTENPATNQGNGASGFSV